MGRVKKQSKAKRLDATACDNNWSAEAEACLWRILVHGISSRSFFFSLSSFGQKLNYQPFTLLILSIHTLYSLLFCYYTQHVVGLFELCQVFISRRKH